MDCVDREVRLTIEEQPSDTAGLGTSTPFEPQPADTTTTPRPSVDDGGIARRVDDAGGVVAAAGPERRLTLLALRLAVLEKAASGLGALGFIWATVVLLGGFAISLGRLDFWCVTVILLVEGARIFSRSHELEWQHQSTWSLGRSSARLVARSFRFVFGGRAKPGVRRSGVAGSCWPPWTEQWSWSFLSGNVGRAFYWLQLASATACAALSVARLARHDFGGDAADARTNRRSALGIFYGLALAEALLFMAERAAWEWEVGHGRLLERVAAECRLVGAPGVLAVRRFFYDAYSRCVEGSVFDGLRMDLVSFAQELLLDGSRDEQRIGVGILVSVAANDGDALRRVAASPDVVERLVDMLGWKGADEAGARASAALVVSRLAGKKRNALRVAGVTGAIESVASLLYAADEECNLLGLLIVKRLARGDHDNCSRIGSTRGLLDKIIDYAAITTTGSLSPSRAKAVRRSLQVIKMLAETTGSTGERLRRKLAGIVFTVSNVRAVLRHADRGHPELRRLAAEVLTQLALDADARDRIGGTGGVVALLLDMFLLRGTDDEAQARVEAGEALAMLALESPRNCERMLKAAGAVDRLVLALDDPAVGVGAARVLTNLCAYSGGEGEHLLRAASATATATATALRRVATTADDEPKPLEAALGLAAQLVRLMTADHDHELGRHLAAAGVTEAGLANRLARVLRSHTCPSIEAPRIRRFTVDLAIELLRLEGRRKTFAALMKAAGMGAELRRVAETTSELECFHVFSGSAGLGRHAVDLAALVDTAMELMGDVTDDDHCTS